MAGVREILVQLMSAAEFIAQCRAELLDHGFSEEEVNNLLHFYVYSKVNGGGY